MADDWARPPHVHFKVTRCGFHELTTQMYFAGNPLNDIDRLLQSLPESERAVLVVDFQRAAGQGFKHGQFDLVIRSV